MKLLSAQVSPFARKVIVLLHETNQLGDVEIVETTGTALIPGSLRLSQNPLGKIPSLERPDGRSIYDSRVICRYLDARAGGVLYPDGERLWDTLVLEATADGLIEAALSIVYEARLRPEELQFQKWMDAQWGKAIGAIEAVNNHWMAHLSGPLDMGQVAIACALGYCDFRHMDRDWRNGNQDLSDWYAAFSERESMQATIPQN